MNQRREGIPTVEMTGPLSRFGHSTRACLFVATLGGPPTGWPFVVRVMDGRLWCTTYRASAKMRAIAGADQAVCLLFVDETSVHPYAVVEGTIEIVEPTRELVTRWFGFPDDSSGSDHSRRVEDRLLSGKRVFLSLVPDCPPRVFDS
jgi:hypothetical protein